MNKYYLFQSDHFIDKKTLQGVIDSFYIGDCEITYLNEKSGYIIADSQFALLIAEALPTINNDLGTKLVIVCAHNLSEVSLAALSYSYQNMQGFNYLSDVVLDQLLINFTDIKQRIINEFNQVPHELVLTAQAYLKSGLNAKAASEMLYIHRNTFNYRLNKFIEITELDIRDYWHAFYFNIYVKLLSK
jgi:hypothetical protein